MLTTVYNLSEVVSSVPDAPRKFHVETGGELGINPDKVLAARSFRGCFLLPVAGTDNEIQQEVDLVDLFFGGGLTMTTMFTDELKKMLFKSDESEQTTHIPHPPMPSNKGDINSWN